MAHDRIEEGEISDNSQSMEEIAEEDFKQESKVSNRGSRVWRDDLLKYPVSSNYGSGLYNFAWAQAVQNKPLSEILMRDFGSVEKSKRTIIDDSRADDVNGVEKEEGELEEGEIELDSEMIEETEGGLSNNSKLARNLEEREFENRIKSIREALGTVTVKDAEISFHGVCSELQRSLDRLELMVMENGTLDVDDLIQQSFDGIRAINSVFCSMNPKQQEQNKDIFSSFLSHVMGQDTTLFSPKQMKEIEAMMPFMDLQAVVPSVKAMEKEKEIQVNNGVNPNELGILGENPSSKKFFLEPIPVIANMGFEIKPGLLSGSSGKGSFGRLLDLHRKHDVDSLPSPTRETPLPSPLVKSELVTSNIADESEDATMYRYETDAFKAFSTYQQKFGRTSNFLTDQLPSPTPSEECNEVDCDLSGEVSSSSTVGNVRTVNPSVSLQPVSSPTAHMDSSSGQTGSNLVLKAKSRDPRLRFTNSEGDASVVNQCPLLEDAPKSETLGGSISSRKHTIIVESVSDGQSQNFKRQRNGFTNSSITGYVPMVSGDRSTVGTQVTDKNILAKNMETDPRELEYGENERLPMIGPSTMASLPSLLRDIAVNPTILMQLIMEQQRLAAGAQKKSSDSAQNTTLASSLSVIPGTVPLVIAAPSKSSETEQKPVGKPQVPAQITSGNLKGEWGQIRMKPRDPRRILHSSTFQKNESLGTEQFKTNGALSSITQASKDNVIVQQGEKAQETSLPSQSTPPDIAQQFTKKLKNLADILSTSEATNTPSMASQSTYSQPIQVKTEKTTVGVLITDSKDQQIEIGSTAEESITGPSRSQNSWGDVEQLFDGYDDQQKVAIQRERARRIEEQNKMFAAQKLCLVLDLDHTLLNSAKFVEVDPMHDEILRKKEEQDQEKLHRHLFRFPHMGMWTKLRPGIWTFLEKASKLYELHLYTMGNKLYATEMAKVLDPTGVLFAGRVLSKGDNTDPFDGDEKLPKNKDLDGVLGMESAVVIIDDSVRVWPHNKLNLIVVERYTYFPCSRRQFGLPGPSLLEIDHDERPEDGTLASSLAVIEKIHENFFSHQSLHDVDVRNVLSSEQRKILAGCRIVFSRIFRVGEVSPHLHPLWQTAEQFGAVCTNQIDEQVTHVVANSLGTDKVNWALSTGRFVVHPGWVEASALLYRRASEQDFAVKL